MKKIIYILFLVFAIGIVFDSIIGVEYASAQDTQLGESINKVSFFDYMQLVETVQTWAKQFRQSAKEIIIILFYIGTVFVLLPIPENANLNLFHLVRRALIACFLLSQYPFIVNFSFSIADSLMKDITGVDQAVIIQVYEEKINDMTTELYAKAEEQKQKAQQEGENGVTGYIVRAGATLGMSFILAVSQIIIYVCFFVWWYLYSLMLVFFPLVIPFYLFANSRAFQTFYKTFAVLLVLRVVWSVTIVLVSSSVINSVSADPVKGYYVGAINVVGFPLLLVALPTFVYQIANGMEIGTAMTRLITQTSKAAAAMSVLAPLNAGLPIAGFAAGRVKDGLSAVGRKILNGHSNSGSSKGSQNQMAGVDMMKGKPIREDQQNLRAREFVNQVSSPKDKKLHTVLDSLNNKKDSSAKAREAFKKSLKGLRKGVKAGYQVYKGKDTVSAIMENEIASEMLEENRIKKEIEKKKKIIKKGKI